MRLYREKCPQNVRALFDDYLLTVRSKEKSRTFLKHSARWGDCHRKCLRYDATKPEKAPIVFLKPLETVQVLTDIVLGEFRFISFIDKG